MSWWFWLILGFSLLTAELLLPSGLFIFFFGVGAICVGLVLMLTGALPLSAQLGLWAAIAVALLAVLRKPFMGRIKLKLGTKPGDFVGEDLIISTEIAPGEIGNGTLRGSDWRVENIGSVSLVIGERVQVAQVDGLTLQVAKSIK